MEQLAEGVVTNLGEASVARELKVNCGAECCRTHLVPAGHQLVSGGGAQRLDVVVLQADPRGGQLVQVGCPDLGLVVAHVVPAIVICQDEDDVRLGSR